MWIQILIRSVLFKIIKGDIISGAPGKIEQLLEVIKITPHYIKVLNKNKKTIVIISPQREIISGKWWIQKL